MIEVATAAEVVSSARASLALDPSTTINVEYIAAALRPIVRRAAVDVLAALYPDVAELRRPPPG